MKMKQSTEFSFQGEDISYDEVEQLWTAVQAAGRGCKVTVEQSQPYRDGPYISPATTTITVEAQ